MSCREEQIRTAMLLGTDAIETLRHARVAVFGIGGVGGQTAEALARAGIGEIDLFDNDVVSLSNINRQIIALHSTIGRAKVEVMKERIADINPDCIVHAHKVFYLPENADEYPLQVYDYIADAIDTVTAKIELAVRACHANVPIISSMGTGNKLDPTAFCVTDLAKTEGCPLSRVMRRELRARGIAHLKVVYSKEAPHTSAENLEALYAGKRPVASISFVPPVAGLIMAGEIIREIVNKTESKKKLSS